MPMAMLRTVGIWSFGTAAAIAPVVPTHAQQAAGRRSYDIAGQRLGPALNLYADQTRTQIMFAPELVRSRWTRGVHGSYTPAQALAMLLGGTGLSGRAGPNNVVLIQAAGPGADPAGSPAPADPPTPPPASGAAPMGTLSVPSDVPLPQAAAGEPGQDIVVTARRRAERLQDIPQSVLALSADTLARNNIGSITGLTAVTPALRATPVSTRRDVVALELRGIGASDIALTVDPAVGVYVNEVVQARPYGFQGGLFDIENVQVLYGPQGTLFGRNTTGGALLVTTKRPQLDGTSGEVAFKIGNYAQHDLEAIVNLPVSDTLAVRVAGRLQHRDGFTHDIVNDRDLDDENQGAWRVSALWQPSPSTSSLFVYEGFRARTNGSGTPILAARPANTPDPAYLALANYTLLTGTASRLMPALQGQLAAQLARGPREVAMSFPLYANTDTWGISNITTQKLGGSLSLKNIVAYRKIKSRILLDLDGTPLDILGSDPRDNADQVSEELQLQGTALDDKLNFTTGLFFFREQGTDITSSASFSKVFAAQFYAKVRNLSYSAYAQGTYKLPVEGLSLTAGIRYTIDKRHFVALSSNRVTGACGLFADDLGTVRLNPCRLERNATFKRPTWNVSLDYKLSRDLLVYLAHRRGYRSGGFNFRASTPSTARPYDAEDVYDIEGGVKASFRLAGMPVQATADAYRTFYRNIQRSVAFLVPGTATATTPAIASNTIANAARATITGGEANLSIEPVRRLTLAGSIAIADARYDRFNTALPNGQPITLRDLDFLNYRTTWNVSGTYRIPLHRSGEAISFGALYSHHSRGNYANNEVPFSDPEGTIPPVGELNLNAGWDNIAGSPISASAFVTNATNKTALINTLSLQQTLGVTTANYNLPRMYGVEVRVRF